LVCGGGEAAAMPKGGKKKGASKSKGGGTKAKGSKAPTCEGTDTRRHRLVVSGNFVAEAGPGVHIVNVQSRWIIDAGEFDPEDYGLPPGCTDVPDISIDPETKVPNEFSDCTRPRRGRLSACLLACLPAI
jgi:hypothetical protein